MGFLVYCITNTVSGKKYVGLTSQSLTDRWSQHVYDSKRSALHLHRAILKYGPHIFSREVLEETHTIGNANILEQKWIGELHTTDRSLGYNLDAGGNAKLTNPETKLKMSKAQRERFAKPGAKEKLSASTQGRRLSQDHRTKLSVTRMGNKRARGNKGRAHSEERKAKIASGRIGKSTRPLRVLQLDPNGMVIAEYRLFFSGIQICWDLWVGNHL